jgi:hypothetical protein
LFDEPSIFGVPSLQPSFTQNPNDPANSFTVLTVEIGALADPEHSGLGDALKNKLAPLFTTLNFFYAVYRAMPADQRADNAISMALAISAAAGPQWQAVLGDDSLADQVTDVLDMNDFTEPFRLCPASWPWWRGCCGR